MRVVEPVQPELADLAIADIKLDLRSRDDIPQLLRGLQHLYTQDELRQQVFNLNKSVES